MSAELEYLVAWQRKGQRPRVRQFANRDDARAWCAALWDRRDAAPIEVLQAYQRPLAAWQAMETYPSDRRPAGGAR